jgi:hypothetical protein
MATIPKHKCVALSPEGLRAVGLRQFEKPHRASMVVEKVKIDTRSPVLSRPKNYRPEAWYTS